MEGELTTRVRRDRPLLSVEDADVRFDGEGGVYALKGATFDLRSGEFVSLLGPSGCGKSSLLKLIAGFLPARSGSVNFEGKPICGPAPERGIVFQEHLLFPWKTVWGNVAFGPRMQRRGEQQVLEISARTIANVGLTGFEQRYPYELSGGMAQRVAVARILASDPEVMLMDEPFGALDSQTRIDMQELLLRVWDEYRKTVLFVTHDIDEAMLLSDRILLMSGRPGRIVEEITVPLPRPRDSAALYGETCLALRKRIFARIREEQRASSAQGALKAQIGGDAVV